MEFLQYYLICHNRHNSVTIRNILLQLSRSRQFIKEHLEKDQHRLSFEIRKEIEQNVLQIMENLDKTKAISTGIPLRNYIEYQKFNDT